MVSEGRHDHVVRLGADAEALGAGLREQRADRRLRRRVVALAERRVAHLAGRVDQVVRGPVLVAPCRPRVEVVVLHDRIADAELPDRAADVAGVALEGELGRLDADDHEPLAAVLRVPGLEVGERADAVDAGVGPEVDQHDVAAQPGESSAAASPGVLNQSSVPVKAGAGPSLRQVRRRHAREAARSARRARTSPCGRARRRAATRPRASCRGRR